MFFFQSFFHLDHNDLQKKIVILQFIHNYDLLHMRVLTIFKRYYQFIFDYSRNKFLFFNLFKSYQNLFYSSYIYRRDICRANKIR